MAGRPGRRSGIDQGPQGEVRHQRPIHVWHESRAVARVVPARRRRSLRHDLHRRADAVAAGRGARVPRCRGRGHDACARDEQHHDRPDARARAVGQARRVDRRHLGRAVRARHRCRRSRRRLPRGRLLDGRALAARRRRGGRDAQGVARRAAVGRRGGARGPGARGRRAVRPCSPAPPVPTRCAALPGGPRGGSGRT